LGLVYNTESPFILFAGAGMHILRIDMHKKSWERQPVPPDWEYTGGRGLIAKILLEEVDPQCNPLGSDNKLIFAPGLLVGGGLSSCDRISVGAKSPLTGGVKEANAGGTTGLALVRLGLKALILSGQPKHNDWYILYIGQDAVRFDPAGDLIGQGAYASAARLIERYDKQAAISLIGPAGELQLLASGILNLDKDQSPSRINARGGLGAVMGSKHIKAIIFDPTAKRTLKPANTQAYQSARKRFTLALDKHPQTAVYRDFGTAAMAYLANRLGGLPTRSFRSGSFEAVERISGEHLRAELLRRGEPADPSHACMPGCLIRCSNTFSNETGQEVVSPLEYETIALMGSNLGIDNLDTVARLNRAANDLGLDSIEVGAGLGVMMDAGVLDYGDGVRSLELLQDIHNPLGRVLGNGAAAVADHFGVQRAPVVKRQAMSAYDARAIKGTGVTYATSPQGADHTAGLTIRANVNHTDPAGQVELSRQAQYNMAGWDTLGACIFAGFGFSALPPVLSELLSARFGYAADEDILQQLGKETIRLERAFNQAAGFRPEDDRIPDWLCAEPLPPTGAVFDVPDEELDHIFPW
jgi:aldehyde:ferredoxin oxidoreductase